jgi:nitrogen fixation protein NifB
MSSKKETNQMRIAVPTDDGTSIAEHFGRSAAFLIFETENGRITGRSTKTNHPKHTQGSCGQHSMGSKAHSHAGILSALKGCDVVICSGMGSGAAAALKDGGVAEIVVTTPGPAEATVSAFLEGKLARKAESLCACRH